MVSAYSLPGTVLPKKKLEISEYAVACYFKPKLQPVLRNDILIEMKIFEEWWNIEKCFQIAHTGKKTYPCKCCDKRLSMSHLVKTHEGTQTEEKPYSCKYCDKKLLREVSIEASMVYSNKLRHHEKLLSRGHKLGKCWKGIFSREKAFYIFQIKGNISIKSWKSYNCDIMILLLHLAKVIYKCLSSKYHTI